MKIPVYSASSTAGLYIGLFNVQGRLIAGRNIGPGKEQKRAPVLDLGKTTLSRGVYCIGIRSKGHSFYDRLNLQQIRFRAGTTATLCTVDVNRHVMRALLITAAF